MGIRSFDPSVPSAVWRCGFPDLGRRSGRKRQDRPVIEGKRVAVVVPAYNEELLLADTLAAIPAFVDRIYVVDDASRDATVERAERAAAAEPRIAVIVHEKNGGVGAAIVTGYKRAIEERYDVTCVMAADNQMPADDLVHLVTPVARGEVDYAKANRLVSGQAWQLIPRDRYLGNAVLSLLTKIASGYWHVADSQSGYTAIALPILEQLDLDRIYARYGFPNDFLVHLNVWNARVRDIPSRPIYGVGERFWDPPAQRWCRRSHGCCSRDSGGASGRST